jgi:predicted neutral ceramidase superfamily lipid hydrolase
MPQPQDLLKDWHEFYLLIGTAAAALIALLFVAASIGAGFMPADRAHARRTYMSPVIFHFSSILFVSLVVLVPSHPRESHSLLIALNAVAGVVASTIICVRLMTYSAVDWLDHIGYGAAPIASYAAVLSAAVVLFWDSTVAPDILAAGLVVLLIANVRNAWDLALTLANRRLGSRE